MALKHVADISVIVPVYNAAPYVLEAIDSVFAQTLAPREIIVVDDGSSDGSAELVAERFPTVRLQQRVHGGPAAARNHGISVAKGALLAFLDADDLWLPEKLERQYAALVAHSGAAISFTAYRCFLSPELDPIDYEFTPEAAAPNQLPLPSSLLCRAELFERLGLLEEDLLAGEFVDWIGRARRANIAEVMLPIVLLQRRIHRANSSAKNPRRDSDYLHVVRAALLQKKKE